MIPYDNLVSCGGSSNKNVAGTGRGEDGIMVQLYFFAILPRGNIQLIGSIDTSDSPMVPANVLRLSATP